MGKVHACPTPGTGIMPCCSRPPLDPTIGINDRMTVDPDKVTCDSRPRIPPPRSEILRQLGRRIRTHRDNAGLSLQDLADRCHMSRAQIQRFETGIREPYVTQLLAIAAALDVRPSALIELLDFDAYEHRRLGESQPTRHTGGRESVQVALGQVSDQRDGRSPHVAAAQATGSGHEPSL